MPQEGATLLPHIHLGMRLEHMICTWSNGDAPRLRRPNQTGTELSTCLCAHCASGTGGDSANETTGSGWEGRGERRGGREKMTCCSLSSSMLRWPRPALARPDGVAPQRIGRSRTGSTVTSCATQRVRRRGYSHGNSVLSARDANISRVPPCVLEPRQRSPPFDCHAVSLETRVRSVYDIICAKSLPNPKVTSKTNVISNRAP